MRYVSVLSLPVNSSLEDINAILDVLLVEDPDEGEFEFETYSDPVHTPGCISVFNTTPTHTLTQTLAN